MKNSIIILFVCIASTANLLAGQIFYVVPNGAGKKDGTSWTNAFSDISVAVNAALNIASDANPCQVWVAQGRYTYICTGNNVEVYGGFVGTESSLDERKIGNKTIITHAGSFNGGPVIKAAVIDSITFTTNPLTIHTGNYTIRNCNFNGVALNIKEASPTVTNCIFNGGSREGIFIEGEYAEPIVTNCTFTDNNYAILIYKSSPNFTVINCTFANNKNYGIYTRSSLTLRNCTFTANEGGIYNYYHSVTMTNCIFWKNSTEIYNRHGTVHINNCIIYKYTGSNASVITEDPLLGELGYYGGTVQTIPVEAGSSAIGTGVPVEGLTTDARGITRSSNPTIGAYEYLYGQPTYEKWILDNNLQQETSSPNATPHNDGITNMEKFAFGLDASKATSYNSNTNFVHASDGTSASLQFPISIEAEGSIQVKALMSTDLINWAETTATAIGTSTDGKFNLYKATSEIPQNGKVFLKLQVDEK